MKNDAELNKIWEHINDGYFENAAKKIHEQYQDLGIVLYPNKLFSDETGDCMGIPIEDGTKREYYRRLCGTEQWILIS